MSRDTFAPLGFDCVASRPIGQFLPLGKRLRPTLCVSDTHLLPTSAAYGADSPHALAGLLEFASEYQLFILGDFIESLPLEAKSIRRLPLSKRLQNVLETLKFRERVRLVPGNHDQNALPFLLSYFGRGRVAIGGFRIGNLVFVHGHELGLDAAGIAERLPMIVSVGGGLSRLGFRVPYGTATNDAIAINYRIHGLYPIFGHTHIPAICETYANTGYFLDDHKSFITIEDNAIKLWKEIRI
jgi:predicted phosphodiesterase